MSSTSLPIRERGNDWKRQEYIRSWWMPPNWAKPRGLSPAVLSFFPPTLHPPLEPSPKNGKIHQSRLPGGSFPFSPGSIHYPGNSFNLLQLPGFWGRIHVIYCTNTATGTGTVVHIKILGMQYPERYVVRRLVAAAQQELASQRQSPEINIAEVIDPGEIGKYAYVLVLPTLVINERGCLIPSWDGSGYLLEGRKTASR
jgi:hypothetical protein